MPAISDNKYLVQADWDDAPHLTEEAKTKMLKETPPHLRDARSKGIPSLGTGAIYPVSEEQFVVDPFLIPIFWPRGYALDVGWNRTAAIWGAHDRDSDIIYLTTEHYQQHGTPAVHAAAIKARGMPWKGARDWQPGVIDPASNQANQKDGEALKAIYVNLGLNLVDAENEVEAGIFDVWSRLSEGRLKVFRTCQNWLYEYRRYYRDKNGKVVKKDDHLMDGTRYLCRPRAVARMRVKPSENGRTPGSLRLVGDRKVGY
jgi:hypothetical protein